MKNPDNKFRTELLATERLMKLHRNFSSRSSTLPSSSSHQSPKPSPVQRREELEQFSKKRTESNARKSNPVTPKSRTASLAKNKAPSNPFDVGVEDKAVTDLRDVIFNVQPSPTRPRRLEKTSACIDRLLMGKSPNKQRATAQSNNDAKRKDLNDDKEKESMQATPMSGNNSFKDTLLNQCKKMESPAGKMPGR
ncbi:hypothetical protein CEXT_211801 [Caerostris extrusa]|uniref:Uncharacterized protein n=1 Tax=Caerostris extrusa TaxID=172846 RepID=A0AAV4PPS9_CAEEX|nr:hypothetical protein CEXT_211801 [Caerostris extrusa]